MKYSLFLRGPEKDLIQAQFCELCGSPLIKECPKCKQPIVAEKEEALYCRFCGANLLQQK
jgi:hypothetical protein